MRAIAIIFGLLLLEGNLAAVVNHPYRRQYVRDTYGKLGLARVGAHAAIGQVRNSPRQWGRGPAGFGTRLASGMATHVVKNTIQFGVAAKRHEDLQYHRSQDKRFGPRLRHALVSTVVTRKTTTGKKTPAAGRVSGAMGAGLVSQAWQPAAARTVAGGVASGGIMLVSTCGSSRIALGSPACSRARLSNDFRANANLCNQTLAADAGANVAREFWPRKKHRPRQTNPQARPPSPAE